MSNNLKLENRALCKIIFNFGCHKGLVDLLLNLLREISGFGTKKAQIKIIYEI